MKKQTFKSLILENSIDIDLFLRFCEDNYDDEFYDDEEDDFKDIVDDIFKYSAEDYIWAASERELLDVCTAINDNFNDFNKKYSNFDDNRQDYNDLAILIFKTHRLTDGEVINSVVDAYSYIVNKRNEDVVKNILDDIPNSYLTVSLLKELNEWFGIEDFIAKKLADGMTELAELVLYGDVDKDMKEFGDNSDMVAVILKNELAVMKDWDTFYKYSYEIGGLISTERLKYALDKGTYKLDKEKFIYFLEKLMEGKNNGHPFKNYGEQAVQEVFDDYDWSDDELNKMIEDSYRLSKIDWEFSYADSNREANRKEAEHIAAQGPNYRHD